MEKTCLITTIFTNNKGGIFLNSSKVIDKALNENEEYVSIEDSEKDFENNKSSRKKYYKIGDKSKNGITIKSIISQNKDMIFYIGENEGMGWEITNVKSERDVAVVAEFQRLNAIVESRVARKYRFKIKTLLGRTTFHALYSDDEDIHLFFEPVKNMIEDSNKEIDRILSEGPNFEIYKTSRGGVSYWYRDIPDYLKPAITEFNQMRNFSAITLPKKDKQLVNSQLASSLSVAFNSQKNEDVLKGFTKLESFINSRANSHAKFWYISYNSILFGAIVLLSLLLYLYSDINKVFIVGAVGGLVGAFLSTLTRIDKLSFDILAPFRNVVLQGYSRLLVGIISGLFIIIASKSNLALGTYSENINSLAVFALISGFSERFVPDLISTLSTKQVDLQNKEEAVKN
ncbi:hypothetical protein ACWFPQ_26235 [Peribacillus butanolivorans]